MKKLLSSLTLIAALVASVQAQAGTLTGEQIFAELGVHYVNPDPFAPGFTSQIQFGTQTVGAGQEWTGIFGANLDFGANTLTASFGSGHLNLPFNGFRFTLANPFLIITNVSILYDSGAANAWHLVLDPAGHGFGFDFDGSTNFTTIIQIDTAAVPDSGATLVLFSMALLGFAGFSRRFARA